MALAYHAGAEVEVTCGYLVVLRFEWLYARYIAKDRNTRDWYAIPRHDRDASTFPIKYRGTDRAALDPNAVTPSSLAELYLAELEKAGRCYDGLLFSQEDVAATLHWLETDAPKYEVIWLRESGTDGQVPPRFRSIGFEPSYLVGDHFSAACDCMMFPKWHGTDEAGVLFLEHFGRLNQHGLFTSVEDATKFVDYYCAFDWTENDRADYVIVEVFVEVDELGA